MRLSFPESARRFSVAVLTALAGRIGSAALFRKVFDSKRFGVHRTAAPARHVPMNQPVSRAFAARRNHNQGKKSCWLTCIFMKRPFLPTAV